MKGLKWIRVFVFVLFVGLFANGGTTSAAGNVYKVDRYGELNYYSGSSVVRIRSDISAISENAFDGVNTTKFVAAGNPYFKTINGVLYSKDGTLLIRCPTEKSGSFRVPSFVKKIAGSAFYNCTKLKSITMPDSVTTIDDYTFCNCSALTGIRLSNKLSQINRNAFRGCSSLVNITIPASVDEIGEKAFQDCQSLQKIAIPDSASDIGGNAFRNCISLSSVSVSKKMRVIQSGTFYNCTSLKSVKNTGNIEEVSYSAFENCVNLKNIAFSNELNQIYSSAFENCISLGTVIIPRNTEYIARSAFIGAASRFIVDSKNPNYSSLHGMLLDEQGELLIQAPANVTGNLKIPRGVTRIADDALVNGSYISITIPEGVVSFEKNQLTNCEKLRVLSLPGSLKKLKGSYYDDSGLGLKNLEKIVVSNGNQNYKSTDGVLYSADQRVMIFFPQGKTGSIRLPDQCKYIGKLMKENQLSAIHISSDNKYFTSVEGVLYNLRGTSIRCFPVRKTSYKVPAKVKDISYLDDIKDKLRCRSVKVSSKNKNLYSRNGVVFDAESDTLLFYPTRKKGAYKVPAFVKYISSNAFKDAQKLTALTITKNVKRRGVTYRFDNCKNLKTVRVKEGKLNYISMDFRGCRKLAQITFPSNIMTTKLKQLPNGVTIYGWKNTEAKEAAERAKGKFVSQGTIPNAVTGPKVRKIIDKYQLSWNATSEASGYQVYTVDDTIKDLKGSGSTSCFIDDLIEYNTIYIRAYKIVNNKKVYGKARRVYT